MFEIHHLFLKLIIKLGLPYNSICLNSYSGKHGKKILSCSILGTEAPWLRQANVQSYWSHCCLFGNCNNHIVTIWESWESLRGVTYILVYWLLLFKTKLYFLLSLISRQFNRFFYTYTDIHTHTLLCYYFTVEPDSSCLPAFVWRTNFSTPCVASREVCAG